MATGARAAATVKLAVAEKHIEDSPFVDDERVSSPDDGTRAKAGAIRWISSAADENGDLAPDEDLVRHASKE